MKGKNKGRIESVRDLDQSQKERLRAFSKAMQRQDHGIFELLNGIPPELIDWDAHLWNSARLGNAFRFQELIKRGAGFRFFHGAEMEAMPREMMMLSQENERSGYGRDFMDSMGPNADALAVALWRGHVAAAKELERLGCPMSSEGRGAGAGPRMVFATSPHIDKAPEDKARLAFQWIESRGHLFGEAVGGGKWAKRSLKIIPVQWALEAGCFKTAERLMVWTKDFELGEKISNPIGAFAWHGEQTRKNRARNQALRMALGKTWGKESIDQLCSSGGGEMWRSGCRGGAMTGTRVNNLPALCWALQSGERELAKDLAANGASVRKSVLCWDGFNERAAKLDWDFLRSAGEEKQLDHFVGELVDQKEARQKRELKKAKKAVREIGLPEEKVAQMELPEAVQTPKRVRL